MATGTVDNVNTQWARLKHVEGCMYFYFIHTLCEL